MSGQGCGGSGCGGGAPPSVGLRPDIGYYTVAATQQSTNDKLRICNKFLNYLCT